MSDSIDMKKSIWPADRGIDKILPPRDLLTDELIRRVDVLMATYGVTQQDLASEAGLQRNFVTDRLRMGAGFRYDSVEAFARFLTQKERDLAKEKARQDATAEKAVEPAA